MVLLNFRVIFNFLTVAVVTTFFAILSLTLLLAQDKTTYTEINGIKSNSTDLIAMLNENSILQDQLYELEGTASHYGKRFHNRKTASGERYNMNEFTAAHRNLPFGTILKVTNINNNRSTFVRINDRGPFIRKRVIDLSFKTATEIDGLGLPSLKIEGFIPGSVDLPKDHDKDYYFAYSLSSKPSIIPVNLLEIRNSFEDFNSAVVHYQELLDHGLIDSLNSFIVFDDESYNGIYNGQDDIYHIAVWKPASTPKIPVMMAEKVYNH